MSIFDTVRGIFGRTRMSVKSSSSIFMVRPGSRERANNQDAAGLELAYRTSEIAYACINIKAQAATDPRLKVERRSGGEWREIEGHPLRALLAQPNPEMDEAAFVIAAIVNRESQGVFYAEIVRGKNGLPAALYPLRPSQVRVKADDGGTVTGYVWTDGTKRVEVAVENMLVWRYYDPSSRFGGLPPLAVALGAVDADVAQTNYIAAFFEMGGVPSGVINVKGREIGDEEADTIRAKWRAKFTKEKGGNMQDVAVFDENASYQQIGARLDQLGSKDLRTIGESRICMVFGVPPLIIYSYAGLQNSTYSNSAQAWSAFWDTTMSAMMKQFRSFLTMQLLTQFEGADVMRTGVTRLAWDMSGVAALQDDVDAVHTRALNAMGRAAITRNEARALIGMPRDPDGDVYVTAYGIVPTAPGEQPVIPARAGDPATTDPTPADMTPPKALPRPSGVKAFDSHAHVLRVLRSRDRVAEKYAPKFERYIDAQYAEAAQIVTDRDKAGAGGEIKDDLADLIDEGLDDGEEAARVAGPMFTAALGAAWRDAKLIIEIGTAFDVRNPAIDRILSTVGNKIKGISDTTREDIRALVGRQSQEGWSLAQLADELIARGAIQSKVRAMLIAHTETTTAYTQGSLLAYKESGVVQQVEWNATLDDLTSEYCKHLNGKKVAIGGKFRVTGVQGVKDWEGDGPPAHPRCRSAILPVVE